MIRLQFPVLYSSHVHSSSYFLRFLNRPVKRNKNYSTVNGPLKDNQKMFVAVFALTLSSVSSATVLEPNDHLVDTSTTLALNNVEETKISFLKGPISNPIVRRSADSGHFEVKVRQRGPCRNVRWTIPLNIIANEVRIHRSEAQNGTDNFEVIKTARGQETTWRDCCLLSKPVVRYAITVVDNKRVETKKTITDPIVVATSFVGESPSVQHHTSCCVKNYDFVENPTRNEFLVVYDCDSDNNGLPDKLFALSLHSDGKKRKELEISARLSDKSDQGFPSAVYNPINREFVVFSQFRDKMIHNGKYVLISHRINADTFQRAAAPKITLKVSGNRNAPEDCRKPKAIYSSAKKGYIVAVEMSLDRLFGTTGIVTNFDGSARASIHNYMLTSVNIINPIVVDEPTTDSVLFLAHLDKKFCSKKNHGCQRRNSHAIMFERVGLTDGSSLYKSCILDQTSAKISHIHAYHDKDLKKTIVCYTDSDNISCFAVGYNKDECQGELHNTHVYPHFAVKNAYALYYKRGKTDFTVWVETKKLKVRQKVVGSFIDKTVLAVNKTESSDHPIAVYQSQTRNVCVSWLVRDTSSSCLNNIRVACLKPSNECNDVKVCGDNITHCRSCGKFVCHENAKCFAQKECRCKTGYTGNGTHCIIDRCRELKCSEYSECKKTNGRYGCSCRDGFEGNGVQCQSIDPCFSIKHNCSGNAVCVLSQDKQHFKCRCKNGFIGDGYQCLEKNCHAEAEIFSQDSLCTSCKLNFFGNGHFCCSQESQIHAVPIGGKASLRCGLPCLEPYLQFGLVQFEWKHKEKAVNASDEHYRFTEKRTTLTVNDVKTKNLGSYTCHIYIENENRKFQLEHTIDLQPKLSGKCGCGLSSINEKPGNVCKKKYEIKSGELPWQASLCDATYKKFCAAVMISKCCFVTAAHCVNDRNFKVCLGSPCGTCGEKGSVCFTPGEFYKHQDYDTTTLENDIALLKLKTKDCLRCNENVRPVCLPHQGERDDKYVGGHSMAVVAGKKKNAKCLKRRDTEITPRRECRQEWRNDLTENVICANDACGLCQGDSGGPLIVKNEELRRYVLLGIVSSGRGCHQEGAGLYTRVAKYLDWIYGLCDSLK
eukprot:m.94487 g.94487  ORF g.94487 m.94487 type:complete len:1105 (+) comp36820_c0_seq3:509-3823(+)